MTAAPVRRLPDPTGAPLGVNGEDVWTFGLALDPTGRYLAQSYWSASAGAAHRMPELAFYARTAATWRRLPAPARAPGQGLTLNVCWSPDGQWLVTSGSENLNEQGTDRRLWVYRRTGDTLTLFGPGPVEEQLQGAGYATNTTLSFDPSGRWLLACDLFGNGSAVMSFDAGTITVTDRPSIYYAGAWHPTEPGVLVALNAYFNAVVYRVDGGRLVEVVNLGGSRTNMVWHPSGRLLLVTEQVGCYASAPSAYTWPDLQPQGVLLAYNFIGNGYAFSPDGRYLAGGYFAGADFDPYGMSIPWKGLLLSAVDISRGSVDDQGGEYAGYAPYEPLVGADQIAGNLSTWGADDGGLVLASSAYPGFQSDFDPVNGTILPSPWGFHTYRIDAGPVTPPAATSALWMRKPGGEFTNVATAAAPLGMVMPDGTMRVWPDDGAPLFMRMPDGTWRQVAG